MEDQILMLFHQEVNTCTRTKDTDKTDEGHSVEHTVVTAHGCQPGDFEVMTRSVGWETLLRGEKKEFYALEKTPGEKVLVLSWEMKVNKIRTSIILYCIN